MAASALDCPCAGAGTGWSLPRADWPVVGARTSPWGRAWGEAEPRAIAAERQMQFPDTIFALSSGRLPAGVAVVRLSGGASRRALELIAGKVPPARRAELATFRN